MKTNSVFYIFSLVFAFSQHTVTAQENPKANTLFGNEAPIQTKDLGFLIAPSFGVTRLDGGSAALFNLRGGVNIKDKVSLGGYFNTSLNDVFNESETIPGVYLDYWTVGGFIEYTLSSKRIFHLTFPLYLGYGEVEMDNEFGSAGLGETNFLQIEPAALLELNLHKFVRFNLGAGYRFVGEMNYRNFNESDISGLTAYFGLKLGLFR